MNIVNTDIKENYSLKELNTFSIDVKAKYFYEFSSSDELLEILKKNRFEDENKFILGGGSNILFSKDFDGLVLKNSTKGKEIIFEDDNTVKLKVGAGEVWDSFVEYCVNKNWSGIENLSLIPGTVGASPIQNIGAYGVEAKDVIEAVEFIDIETLEVKTLPNNKCNFGYRDSIFKHELKNKSIITSVVFKLNKKSEINLSYKALKDAVEAQNISNPSIEQIRKIIIDVRQSKLPDEKEYPNCGSFFKNPEVNKEEFLRLSKEFDDLKYFEINDDLYKIPAGWMIDKCGMRGYRKGNVGTFDKQALVIVNYNNASGQEVIEFSNFIREKVFSFFGINIETEVNIL